ncbi:MAG: cysteine synthase A [Candidatus Omnitrophota bacterium]|nr:cysteine synthase A [Candidatus Omnitrophota bacterium]
MNIKKADNILKLIGNTPMVRLNRVTAGLRPAIWAKVESFNPGGSIKDRVALAMVEQAEQDGDLKSRGVILEATSGNTGIGLALIAGIRDYKLILTMPEDVSIERRKLLTTLGAELVLTPKEEGMVGAVNKADEIAKAGPDYFRVNQFNNPANPEAHRRTTAQEIWSQTQGKIDLLVAGVGTGGTITGIGGALKLKKPDLEIIAVEPATSAVLSGERPGPHRIQGIGPGFIPEVLNRTIISRIIKVSDRQAVMTTRRLMQEEGLIVGISSGAACFAALEIARDLGKDKNIIIIFPDRGFDYVQDI